MAEADFIRRFLFEHSNVRGEIVKLDTTWRTVVQAREYHPSVQVVLGQAMAAAALLVESIKIKGGLTLQIQGAGPVTTLVVHANSDRSMRATVKCKGTVSDGGLRALFGDGYLVITIDPGGDKDSYQGIVSLDEHDLPHTLEAYFQRSEQLATRFWLAVDENQVAGLLLQKMPGDSEDADAWNRVTLLADTLQERELLQLSDTDLLRRLFHEETIRVFDPQGVSFRCRCSRATIERILIGLGREEMDETLQEQGTVLVECDFCNRAYAFDAVDIELLFTDPYAPDLPPTQH